MFVPLHFSRCHTCIYASKESAEHYHFKGFGHLAESRQDGGYDHKDVVNQQGHLPSERRDTVVSSDGCQVWFWDQTVHVADPTCAACKLGGVLSSTTAHPAHPQPSWGAHAQVSTSGCC